MRAPGATFVRKAMSHPRSRREFERLVLTGENGSIRIGDTRYHLVHMSSLEHYEWEARQRGREAGTRSNK